MTGASPSAPVAVAVEGLSKRYRIGTREEMHATLVQATLAWVASPLANYRRLRRLTRFADDDSDVVWALREVSFTVSHGEVVGIVGRNGAGKSTLLKVLSSITSPTHGRVVIEGSVASLLEVGTGFHPELTGRENVYLNGTILGLTRRQIDRRFDSIVDFAGVERFLDTPVKRYSSGMRVRLGFAVAAHLEPEVLLIDEVLAVGDSAFQRKCLGKMREVARGGRTVLFVSHNMAAVSALCDRVVLLEDGRVSEVGDTDAVIDRYLRRTLAAGPSNLLDREGRSGDGALRVAGLEMIDEAGVPIPAARVGQTVAFVLRWTAPEPARDVTMAFTLADHLGRRVVTLWTEYTGQSFAELPAAGAVRCTVPSLPLVAGTYSLSFSIKVRGVTADQLDDALEVAVVPGDFYGTGTSHPGKGAVLVAHSWEIAATRQEGTP